MLMKNIVKYLVTLIIKLLKIFSFFSRLIEYYNKIWMINFQSSILLLLFKNIFLFQIKSIQVILNS